MLLSASRRTDIPAFFTPWLLRRLREGFALVRNPFNAAQVSRLSLAPADLDGIVFWSKNPAPLFPHLPGLAAIPWYLHYTITGYGPGPEPGVPSARCQAAPLMAAIARKYGRERVIWRYDPVFLSPRFTPAWHLANFADLCRRLAPHCAGVSLSFMVFYAKTRRNMARLSPQPVDAGARLRLLTALAALAADCGLPVFICGEDAGQNVPGASPGRCMDGGRLAAIAGRPLPARKRDPGQRSCCGCSPSRDLGAYHSCRHGCLYCYATASQASALANASRHDPASPILL